MSSQYRIGAQFYGTDAGLISATNQALYGVNRLGQGFRQSGRDASVMSGQIKAIGTTLRYYLAGRAVFGITGAIGGLQEFKNELGVINGLAGKLDSEGKFHGLGNQLQDLGSDALLLSNHFGVAVGDIESYMQRFYSAFEPTGTAKDTLAAAKQWANDIAGLQVTLGKEAGDPDALGGGIAGFINSIPGGDKDIAGNTTRIANMIAYLTQKTPNITGRNIANDIGRIGSTMQLTDMTPEQAFAVWTSAGKSGGSAAVIGRGITQLMAASLLHPQSPAQKAAFQSAVGTSDPSQLRSMGGFEVLKKLLDYVQGNVKLGDVKNLEQFNTTDDLNDALTSAGLNQGGLTKLYDLFGRQESVRQFINLLGEGGSKALDNFIDGIDQATAADLNQQRVNAAMSQRGLAVFQQSMSNLNLSLVRGMEFPLETIGKMVKFVSDQTAEHRTTTTVATSAAATLYATRLLGKFGAFNTLDRRVRTAEEMAGGGGLSGRMRVAQGFLKFAKGASAAERSAVEGALMAEAGPQVITGGAADGSRGNPFWVIIHPYSNYVGVQGGAGGPIGGGGGDTNVIPINTSSKKMPTWARGVGGKVIGVGTAYMVASQLMNNRWNGKDSYGQFASDVSSPFRAIHGLFGGSDKGSGGKVQDAFWTMMQQSKATQRDALGRPTVVHGKFDPLHVKATMVDKKGNVLGTAEGQAPVKLWGPSTFPSSQGKPGSRTGGST